VSQSRDDEKVSAMTLHVFLCASPLYPQDRQRDEALHVEYLDRQIESCTLDWVRITIIQNGCRFPHRSIGVLRNPIAKNVSYNWLVCDVNCEGEYWLFLPEDCRISRDGWEAIGEHMQKGKDCFALSKDPKAIVCRRGIFRSLPEEVQILCDMNALGKEIGCVLLRGELERHGLHCISKNWRRVSEEPKRWGNELYEEMNAKDHPVDVNKTRALPIFQDYGIDGWKAPVETLESTFMKIIEKNLDRQRQAADKMKSLVAHYGPLITEVPYRGPVKEMWDRLTGAGPSHQ
jgi:hypothetical protein